MKNTTYLALLVFNFSFFNAFAKNACSNFLENQYLTTEALNGKSLNADEIFSRLDEAGPLRDQLKWLAVIAKYSDGTEVLQFGARVIVDKLDKALQESLKTIIERSSEVSDQQRALRLADLDPERIERFYLLHPERKTSPLAQVFKNGIEFLTIAISDTEGEVLGLKTFTSYLPDSVNLSLFDLADIENFIKNTNSQAESDGKMTMRIDIFHNHPEPEPLSPSDVSFARFMARKYGLVSEIYALVKRDEKVYLFVSPIAIGNKITISD